jgi:DNA-binding SARP family transcriptional activator/predicted ATPase
MAFLSLSMLGGFVATLDGKPVSGYNSNKVRALLAYLAVETGRPHRRETLATMLWPDSSERYARTNLRNALANLRKVLHDDDPDEPFILVTRDALQFNRASNTHNDVSEFNSLMNSEHLTVQQLQHAVDLYQGSFLQGFTIKDSLAFDDWTFIMQERLHRKAISALQALSKHYEQQGDYDQACEFARRQVEIESWNEETHRNLMRLLAISGQRGAALKQYDICRQMLDTELGVTPSRETTELFEQIRDGRLNVVAVRKASEPAVPSKSRHNLPVQLTPFLGRAPEMTAIAGLLQDTACRLLTLIGPGGCGKTRLAIETGIESVDRYRHGVYWISLAPIQSTNAIISTLANALDITFQPAINPRQQICNYLRNKHMLLIFDNFEHLLLPSIDHTGSKEEDAVDLILDILTSAPDVQIIVTSRTVLNIQGEVLYAVTGLEVPESTLASTDDIGLTVDTSQYTALQLFEISARRISFDFTLSAENLLDVVRICRLVDGMPLGILMAAGWVRILTPAEIAKQILNSLDFLTSDIRDLPKRQRSMRSVLNQSWKLLSTREREIMLAISVFKGPTSRTAIQAVTGATLWELSSLKNKSLLTIDENGYYEVHELVRHYAGEKLAQLHAIDAAVRNRYSTYYTTALTQWAEEIRGPEQETALWDMSRELENIYQVWVWNLDHGIYHKLYKVTSGLIYFFMYYGRLSDGLQWYRLAVERIEGFINYQKIDMYVRCNPADVRVYALILAHYVLADYWMNGRSDRTSQYIVKGRLLLDKLKAAGHDIRQDKVDFVFSTVDACEGPILDMLMQSLDTCQTLRNRWGIAQALHELGWVYWTIGDFQKSEQMFQQGLIIARDLGTPRLIVAFLKSLAYMAWESGRYTLTRQLCEEELTKRQALSKHTGMVSMFESMAHITLHQGNLVKAVDYANACISMSKETNFIFHTQVGLRRLGIALMASGDYEQALMNL